METFDPTVPKRVMRSPQKQVWIRADFDAHMHILKYGQNRLIRRDAVPAGALIANCVTMRKIKKTATGELDPHSPWKSRHCFDGGRFKAIMKAKGLESHPLESVNIVDDLTFKLVMADVAIRDRILACIDIGNAYAKGERRNRPLAYMHMAATKTSPIAPPA